MSSDAPTNGCTTRSGQGRTGTRRDDSVGEINFTAMPNRYLIANWKMNLPPEGIDAFLGAVRGEGLVVAPSFVYLKDVVARAPEGVAVAAQNCADRSSGAFTGEVSAAMVRHCGGRFVI